jgi:hypothetical protein
MSAFANMSSRSLGCNERHNSQPKNVIFFFLPDVVLGAGEAMRRREFIVFVSDTGAAWFLVAYAQQPAIELRLMSDISVRPRFVAFIRSR